MYSKELLLACLGMLLGGLRLTSTTTTTTFVAALSISSQDIGHYFRSVNATQTLVSMQEERIAMDVYTYAYLNYTYMNPEPNSVSWSEEKARYGEGEIFNVTGKLVHVTRAGDSRDDSACSPNILGTRGDPTPTADITWIALIQRGGCTFEEKVANAFAKGAAGVIIYNDKQVMSLEKMQIKGKTRNITAVITYQDIGLEMARIVDQGIDMDVTITSGRKGMRPINSLNRTSVLFVSISFVVLMVISLVWLIFYYIQRLRYLQTKDQQSRHLCSVTKKAIMKIPTRTGKSSDEKDSDSDCCAICIEVYKASDCIRVLPCKHEFHKNCIDPWLLEHRTCPMCKLDVLKFYGFVFLGSEESILEYEPNRTEGLAAGGASDSHRRTSTSNRVGGGGSTLTDLIRSRDYVIDFPRLLVLNTGGTTPRDSLLPMRLPERSQSSLSLAHAKDWTTLMTNKLEEQHVQSSAHYQMQENLLGVGTDLLKKRRSRSADGCYSSGYSGNKELARQLATGKATAAPTHSNNRRNNVVLRDPSVVTHSQSKQRQREQLNQANARRHRSVSRRNSDVLPRELSRRHGASKAPGNSEADEAAAPPSRENSWPLDVDIQIQINGEGIDLD